MKKNFKRVIGIVLTVIMILTVFPLSVMSYAINSTTITLYVKDETDRAVTLAVKLTSGSFNNLDFKIIAKGENIKKCTSANEADDFKALVKEAKRAGATCNYDTKKNVIGNVKAAEFTCESTSAFNKADINIVECKFEKTKASAVLKSDFEITVSACELLNDKNEKEAVDCKAVIELPEKPPILTVNFDAGKGRISPDSATVENGKTVVLPTPTYDGYDCLGWDTDTKAETAKYKCGAEFMPENDITLYAVWREIDKTKNGIIKVDGKWMYYKEGLVDTAFEGMAKNQYGWWYVKDGTIDFTYTGMAENDFGWWYMNKGKLDLTFTGMAKGAADWMYATKGKLDEAYTGLAKNQYGWFYMTNGRIDPTFTGMAKNQYGWWYVKGGGIDFTYTGMAENQYGWWHIKNGKLDLTFTGIADGPDGLMYAKNGKFDSAFTGLVKGSDGWLYVASGKAEPEFTGMAKNQYGWWYVKDGKIDLGYSGLASSAYGVWCFNNGRINTAKTETVNDEKGTYKYSKGEVIYTKLNVPIVSQRPKYPTGCEAASATTVLNYNGIDISLDDMVKAIPSQKLYKKDGKAYGPSINEYFVGDPAGTYTSSVPGYGAFSPVITKSLNDVLDKKHSKLTAKNISGSTVNELCTYVAQGKPIIVWATYKMVQPTEKNSWFIESPTGDIAFSYPRKTHVMVLVGFDRENVIIADPYDNSVQSFKKTLFAKRYNLLGNQAIVVE